jgi:hypothetical protein
MATFNKFTRLASFFLLLYSIQSFSQGKETSKTLPLLTIRNSKFLPILDSVISFSKNCHENGLKYLTFYINISPIDYSTTQVYITLLDCQLLDIVLRSTDRRDSPVGYFNYLNQTFIVSGQIDNFDLFETTKTKRAFNLTTTGIYLKAEYSAWFYQYTTECEFQLLRFDPWCDSPNN